VLSKFVNSTSAVSEVISVDCKRTKPPPPASAKDNCPTADVPEPLIEATFKNLSAVIFSVGNLTV
jgi:hypothetical protein